MQHDAVEGLALFGTPVFSFTDTLDPALDRELTQRLVHESETSPGIARSNSGGWHSVPDLSQRPEDCWHTLLGRMVSGAQTMFAALASAQGADLTLEYRYAVQAWAMVMRHGDYTLVHDHQESHFSMVYYSEVGDADLELHPDSGRLCFLDPRRGGTVISGIELFPSQFGITPQNGQLVVFPSWLQHFVHPYRGVRPRVSISCNLRFEADLR